LTELISKATIALILNPIYAKVVKILSILTNINLEGKPLKCPTCLPFWITMIVLIINGTEIPYIILFSFVASYLGELLFKRLTE